MTTNFRVRKGKRSPHRPLPYLFAQYYMERDFHFPHLTTKQQKALRHGDVLYRGLVHSSGATIYEYRVLGRPAPRVAFTHKCAKYKKERLDNIQTTYVLHARDKHGARFKMEDIDFPMTFREKLKLAKSDPTDRLDPLMIPVVCTGFWQVRRLDRLNRPYNGDPQYMRDRHNLEVTTDHERLYFKTIRSLKDLYAKADSGEGYLFARHLGELMHASNFRSGLFTTRTLKHALSLARTVMGSVQGTALLKSLHEEHVEERRWEELRDRYEYEETYPEDEDNLITAYDMPEQPSGPDPIWDDPIFDIPPRNIEDDANEPDPTAHLTGQQIRALGVEE